jgi:hypothetical protein
MPKKHNSEKHKCGPKMQDSKKHKCGPKRFKLAPCKFSNIALRSFSWSKVKCSLFSFPTQYLTL